jgi:N-acetyl-anhydromuramyl-L-alanine amidase AmpD
VFDSKKAWHAGKSKWKGYVGLNRWSVSIAFSGDTYKREVSNIEIDSCAKKCIYLMQKFDLKIEDIITHEMIAPGRKNDPAPAIYNRVIARIKYLLQL